MDIQKILIKMAKIEQKLDNITESLEENKRDHDKLYQSLEHTNYKIEKNFRELDKKYAAKYVEKVFWITLTTLITLFITAIWYLLIK